jgi:hypothetical protein
MGKSDGALRKDFSTRFALDPRQQTQEYHRRRASSREPRWATELEKEVQRMVSGTNFQFQKCRQFFIGI